jgi:hypothetical protein
LQVQILKLEILKHQVRIDELLTEVDKERELVALNKERLAVAEAEQDG